MTSCLCSVRQRRGFTLETLSSSTTRSSRHPRRLGTSPLERLFRFTCENETFTTCGCQPRTVRLVFHHRRDSMTPPALQRTRRERRGLQSLRPVGRVAELGSLGGVRTREHRRRGQVPERAQPAGGVGRGHVAAEVRRRNLSPTRSRRLKPDAQFAAFAASQHVVPARQNSIATASALPCDAVRPQWDMRQVCRIIRMLGVIPCARQSRSST